MFIPNASITARAWGSTIKSIACVHCGKEFVYEFRRQVSYQANAPLYIGVGNARERAQAGAQELLARTLKNDDDPVPCPGCGRLQPTMNRSIKKRWTVGIIVVWIAILFVALFRFQMAQGEGRPAPLWVLIMPVLSTLLAVLGLIWIWTREFRRASTDRAQLLEEAEAENFARVGMPRIFKNRWIWLRATRFVPPAHCARCGATATETLSRKLNSVIGPLELEAKVCKACHRRANRFRLLTCIAIALLPIISLFFYLRVHLDWETMESLVAAGLGGGMFGFIVLVILNNWFLDSVGFPIRVRNYRAIQDSVELQFPSDATAELFLASAIEQMQNQMSNPTEDASDKTYSNR